MDITQLSIKDLKALAFNEIQRLNLTQSNLQTIYAEISKRMEQPEQPLKKASKNDHSSKN